MTLSGEIREILLELVDLLEAHRVPYLLMGGIAVTIWGVPRATYDLDLTLAADDAGLHRFLDLVAGAGFDVDQAFAKGFRDVVSGMEKISIAKWTPASRRVEVDVFLATNTYQQVAFARRCRIRIEHRDAWVLSPADLILHKLVAGRAKDLADVQNLLAVQGLIDADYLRTWSARLGVMESLNRSLREAGLSPSA